MVIAAIGMLVAWVALLALARVRPSTERARAWKLNAGLLAGTLATSLVTCAAPIVPLVSGFEVVAVAAPADKAAVLESVIDGARPAMPVALLALPVLVIGVVAFVVNLRRLRRMAQRERNVIDAF
jgi:hypothetical protein